MSADNIPLAPLSPLPPKMVVRICIGCGKRLGAADEEYCALCGRHRFSLPMKWRRLAGGLLVLLSMGTALAVYYHQPAGRLTVPTTINHCAVYAMEAMAMGLALGFPAMLLGMLAHHCFENRSSSSGSGITDNYKPPPAIVTAAAWLGLTFLGISQFVGVLAGWATGFLRFLDFQEQAGAVLTMLLAGSVAFALFHLQPHRRRSVMGATFFSHALPLFPCTILGVEFRIRFGSTLLQDSDRQWGPALIVLISIFGYFAGSWVGDQYEPSDRKRTKFLMGFLLAIPSAMAYMLWRYPRPTF